VPAGRLRVLGQPVLRAGEFQLRAWVPGDAGVLLRAYADPAIRFWNLTAIRTRADADATISGWGEGWAAERAGNWAVAEAATGWVLGRVSLRFALEHGVADCTYWTLPEARRRGVAVAAVGAVCRWGFRGARRAPHRAAALGAQRGLLPGRAPGGLRRGGGTPAGVAARGRMA
jgi:RimJ/RimL family protein N-acetyltransferase